MSQYPQETTDVAQPSNPGSEDASHAVPAMGKKRPTRPLVDVFHRHRTPVIATLLFALVLVTFWPALSCDFINLDDQATVYESPEVIRGLSWEGVRYAFTHTVVGHWAPLTTLSHMLDCQFYGLQPWGHHLTNVLLHGVATVLLFLVLRQMTGALWRCAFVAALWAVHPLRVESVVWVTERKDVLSGVFFMLTLGTYAHYVRRPSVWRYLAVTLCFVLGLMSKSMLVTLPFALLLLDFWPLRRPEAGGAISRLLSEKLILLGLSLILSTVQVWAVRNDLEATPFFVRLGNAVVSYVVYLGKILWPGQLAVFYPHPGTVSLVHALSAVIVLLGISLLLLVLRRRSGYAALGWCWFLGMLVPVIGLLQLGGIAMADRYTYLPSIGILVALVWGVHRYLQYAAAPFVVRGLAAVAVVISASVLTINYAKKWMSSETLFRHALLVTKDNWKAHSALAGSLVTDPHRAQEVPFHCREALRIKPTCAEALNYLGMSLTDQPGRLKDAITAYRTALLIAPRYVEAHNNLGVALAKNPEHAAEAISHYRTALDLRPGFAEAHNNLGLALTENDPSSSEALVHFETAIRLKPAFAEPYFNLGNAMSALPLKSAVAITHFQEALRIRPDYFQAVNNLGLALLRANRPSEAAECFEKALTIKPDYVGAHYNLGMQLSTNPARQEQAIYHFSEACRIDPSFERSKQMLLRLQSTPQW